MSSGSTFEAVILSDDHFVRTEHLPGSERLERTAPDPEGLGVALARELLHGTGKRPHLRPLWTDSMARAKGGRELSARIREAILSVAQPLEWAARHTGNRTIAATAL